jgi:sulfate/thiosulfate transport system ATP-binding protein
VHVTTIFVTHDQEEAMEVAEQIVVFNEGRIEQAGQPRDLYESPENEFVMTFVGPVNRLGDAYIRPHDMDIALEPGDTTVEAMIERIVYLGFEVRIEFRLPDNENVWMHLSRSQAEELELADGQIVYIRPRRSTVFKPHQPPELRQAPAAAA